MRYSNFRFIGFTKLWLEIFDPLKLVCDRCEETYKKLTSFKSVFHITKQNHTILRVSIIVRMRYSNFGSSDSLNFCQKYLTLKLVCVRCEETYKKLTSFKSVFHITKQNHTILRVSIIVRMRDSNFRFVGFTKFWLEIFDPLKLVCVRCEETYKKLTSFKSVFHRTKQNHTILRVSIIVKMRYSSFVIIGFTKFWLEIFDPKACVRSVRRNL
jgi:hypothetical protein